MMQGVYGCGEANRKGSRRETERTQPSGEVLCLKGHLITAVRSEARCDLYVSRLKPANRLVEGRSDTELNSFV